MNASMSSAQDVDAEVDDESALPMFWLSLFAAILIVGLLFAFQQVVHAAVDRADAKRISDSVHAHSAWLCNSAPTRAERNGCLAQSIGLHNDSTAPATLTHVAFEPATAVRP